MKRWMWFWKPRIIMDANVSVGFGLFAVSSPITLTAVFENVVHGPLKVMLLWSPAIVGVLAVPVMLALGAAFGTWLENDELTERKMTGK